MKLSNFFSRKKQAAIETIEKEVPEWERFDLDEFAKGTSIAANRLNQTLPAISKDSAAPRERPAKHRPSDDADLSFDELMAQYHEYEREVDGASDTRSSKGAGTATGDDAQPAWARAAARKQDILASRHGKPAPSGSRAPITIADVDRRAGPLRRGRERLGSDDGRSARGSVHWASEDGGSDADSEPRGPAAPGRRPASHDPGGAGAGGGVGRTVVEKLAARAEPMGDALMVGAKGFINLAKRGLLSLPMGAYTGAMLGNKVGDERESKRDVEREREEGGGWESKVGERGGGWESEIREREMVRMGMGGGAVRRDEDSDGARPASSLPFNLLPPLPLYPPLTSRLQPSSVSFPASLSHSLKGTC
jgi:hypothetical protein